MVYNSIGNNDKASKMSKNEETVRRLENTDISYYDGHYMRDGIAYPITKHKVVKMTSTKRFHNCLYLIMGLSKCERLLMDWLSEEMDDDNIVVSDDHMRNKFIRFINGITVDGKVINYKPQTVANAFNDLVKREDLLLRFSKGRYKVNPEYYWRGKDEDRLDAIMMNIQFNSGESNYRIINKSQEYVTVKKTMLKR